MRTFMVRGIYAGFTDLASPMQLASIPVIRQNNGVKHISLFLVGLCLVAQTTSAAKTLRPNIIIAMADDMGWSDIG